MKNISAQEQVSVLTVQGDLDLETFPRLLRQAEASFEEGKFNLLIDLRQAGSISRDGLIALHTIAARSELLGGKTVFSGVTATTAHMIKLTGYAGSNCIPDLVAAQASFVQA